MVILAILAALGVTSMNGFTDRAKQSARESVARTIFMAGQTALTHAYNQDRDFYINNRSPIIPTGNFLPGDEPEKLTHNPPALVYLKMDKGGANSALPLYTMLSPYLNDKAVLNESILIEYNRETGKMLSVFYSDVPDVTFGYGSGGSYDVRLRDDSALKKGKVGYYGVASTGEVIRPDPLKEEDYSVLLVDHTDPTKLGYGLLTAEIKIKADIWNSDTISTMQFRLSLLPMGRGKVEDLTFTKNSTGDGIDFRASELVSIDSIEQAIVYPREITEDEKTRLIPVYLEDYNATTGYCTIVVIIDGVQSIGSTATSINIRDTFPDLLDGFLYAELEAVDNSESVSVYSDDKSNLAVHTLYGYDSAADNTRFTVMSVRHLNNIRYCAEGNFEQTQSIYMWDYRGNSDGEGHPLNFKPLCNRLDHTAEGSAPYGFTGSYTSNAAYAIFDFTTDLTVQPNIPQLTSDRDKDNKTLLNAGLFDTILSGGRVSNVRFAVSQSISGKPTLVTLFADSDIVAAEKAIALVKGIRAAGGIAAFNGGTIENCMMLGYVSAKGGDEPLDGMAGAIAGSNTGTIARCASLCTVHGERYVGGIAGASSGSGSIRYCEAGTASWRTWSGGNGEKELFRAGTPAYGASDTQNGVYKGGYETANNTHRLIIMNSDGFVGGITGYASEGATVIGCVNACKVESGNIKGSGEGANTSGNVAGGIVGRLSATNTNHTAVGYCYNAGEVDAASRGSGVNAVGGAGGIVGEVVKGKIASCYNTGTVNLQTKELKYDYDDMTYQVVDLTLNLYDSPPDSSGGLIGHGGEGTVIEYCYSAQYTGNAFGGAFGELGEGARVENCGFLGNVRNTENEYYTGQVDAQDRPLKSSNGIVMYDPEELRRAPTDLNLSNAFSDGSFLNPVGVFKYQYPYLARVPSEGNLPGHRTPYTPTIARYGDISLKGSMKENDYIYCTFYIAPPKGYINIYAAASAYTQNPELICCIPLFDRPGFNSLTDARKTADTSWEQLEADGNGFIYGYNYSYEDLMGMSATEFANLKQDYTFRIKAHKLNPYNESEAKHVAMGYSYQYTIRMTYGPEKQEDVIETHISSNDYTFIRAELFNTAEGVRNNRNHVASDDIGRCYMWITDPVDRSNPALLNTTARALVISGMPLDETKNIVLNLDYAELNKTQQIILPAKPIFSSNAPRNFDEAIRSSKSYDFDPGPKNPAAPSNGFKYFVQDNSDGTKALYLLLWVAQTPIDPPAKYNGLYEISGDDPVVIKAQRDTTRTPATTVCERTFWSWEVDEQ